MWAVSTICWSRTSRARGSSPRRRPARRARANAASMSTLTLKAARPWPPSASGSERPRRGEIMTAKVGGRAVLHALDVLGLVGQAAPGHLVGRVDGSGRLVAWEITPSAPRFHTASRCAARRGARGQDDLALHLLALVVGVGDPRAHVHELRGDVRRCGCCRRWRPRPRRRRRASRLRRHEPGLARRARPAVAVVGLADELARPRGPASAAALRIYSAAAKKSRLPARAVVVGQLAVVLEGAVAGDLVHEGAVERLGQEGRGLRAAARQGAAAASTERQRTPPRPQAAILTSVTRSLSPSAPGCPRIGMRSHSGRGSSS